MDYVIEMGVPIPPLRMPRGRAKTQERAALESLPVGGMVRLPALNKYGAMISHVQKDMGWSLTRRVVDGKLCVWRIA